MKHLKEVLNHIGRYALLKLRLVIALIGILTFFALGYASAKNDPSTVVGGLLINLMATALTIVFTALLIDWLQERRQRLLVSKPLQAAKHELSSACLMIGFILGRPYLNKTFDDINAQFAKDGQFGMKGLARLRKALIDALADLTPETCPATTQEVATALTPQITDRIASIDEVLRLYGFAFDAGLRDQVFLLRDRLVSLRNSLGVFEWSGEHKADSMQTVVALGIQGLVEAIQGLDIEWVQVES